MQVLFAFLLIVPFSKGFAKVTEAERVVFFAAVCCTVLSTALLIAPTSYHRLRFRDHDKESLIATSNRMAIAGTVFLALAMSCAVFLISEYVFNLWVGSIATAATGGVVAWLWYTHYRYRGPPPVPRRLLQTRPSSRAVKRVSYAGM